MTRILFALLLLSSCGNLPITYIQNFSSINSVVFGFPEYEITEDIFNEYENSFLKIRFGRGPHAILILAYVEDNIYEWVGADGVRIFTLDGRVIKTSGLTSNSEILKPLKISDLSNESYETITLYNPDLHAVTIKRSTDIRNTKIKKLGKNIQVKKIEEYFSVEVIGWKGKNIYYQNPQSKMIEFSEQKIHPKLPTASLEYYIKY